MKDDHSNPNPNKKKTDKIKDVSDTDTPLEMYDVIAVKEGYVDKDDPHYLNEGQTRVVALFLSPVSTLN